MIINQYYQIEQLQLTAIWEKSNYARALTIILHKSVD